MHTRPGTKRATRCTALIVAGAMLAGCSGADTTGDDSSGAETPAAADDTGSATDDRDGDLTAEPTAETTSDSADAPTTTAPTPKPVELSRQRIVEAENPQSVTLNAPDAATLHFAGTVQRAESGQVTVEGQRGATGLAVAADTNGEIAAMALVAKPAWYDGEIEVTVDSQSSVIALAVTQLGIAATDPELAILAAGLIVASDRFDAAVATFEASERPFDDPDVAEAIGDVLRATETELRANKAESSHAIAGVHPFRTAPEPDSNCPQEVISANSTIVTFEKDIAMCLENVSGRYTDERVEVTISGINQAPRWGLAVDYSSGRGQLVGLIPPRQWQIPGFVELMVDLLQDALSGQIVGYLEVGTKTGCKALGLLNVADCEGELGRNAPERIIDRLASYVSDAEFEFTYLPAVTDDPSAGSQLVIYTGLSKSPEADGLPSGGMYRTGATALTMISLVVLPVLSMVADIDARYHDEEALLGDPSDFAEALVRFSVAYGETIEYVLPAMSDETASTVDFATACVVAVISYWRALVLSDLVASFLKYAGVEVLNPEKITQSIIEEAVMKAIAPTITILQVMPDVANLTGNLIEYRQRTSRKHGSTAVDGIGDLIEMAVPDEDVMLRWTNDLAATDPEAARRIVVGTAAWASQPDGAMWVRDGEIWNLWEVANYELLPAPGDPWEFVAGGIVTGSDHPIIVLGSYHTGMWDYIFATTGPDQPRFVLVNEMSVVRGTMSGLPAFETLDGRLVYYRDQDPAADALLIEWNGFNLELTRTAVAAPEGLRAPAPAATP